MMKKLTILALCGPLSLLVACGGDDPAGADVPATCNNGSLDVGEQCDGSNLANTTCAGIAGFTGGVLSCKDCKFVTTGCTQGMSYAGTYEMRATYDFSEFLPDYVRTMNAALKSPGEALLDAISVEIAKRIGLPTMALWVEGILDSAVGTYLDTLNTDEVQKMSTAVSAAVDFTKNITIVGTLTLTAPTTVGGDVQVKETWDELLYKWTYNCTAGAAGCGEFRLPIAGLTGTQTYTGAGMDLNSSIPRITLATSAAPRIFQVPYNEIIKSYYEKVIIPKITGNENTTSLEGLVTWLIDCPTLASRIATSDDTSDNDATKYSGVGVPLDTTILNTLCAAATGAMGAKLSEELTAAIDLGTIKVSGFGEGKLVDSDGDKKADSISGGVLTNVISLIPKSGGSSTDVTPDGSFTATRK